jgi:wobble nucleotide-excising tRNase
VELARSIVDLDKEQRDLDAVLKAKAEIIRTKCPVILASDVSGFCTRDVPTDVGVKIEEASRNVQLASQAAVVKMKSLPTAVLIKPAAHYFELLDRTLHDVSDDAISMVESHIEKHDLGVRGRKWLEYGSDHSAKVTCPFCDQPISGIALVASLRAYFSQAFSQLLSEIDGAVSEIQLALSDKGFELAATNNSVDFAFWRQVCDLPDAPSLTESNRNLIAAGLNDLADLFSEKSRNPLKIPRDKLNRGKIFTAISLIVAYNEALAIHTVTIVSAQQAATGANLVLAQQVHQKLEALAAKLHEPVKTAAAEYGEAEIRRLATNLEKAAAQEKLRNYASTAMSARQTDINTLLEDFGANFKIVDAKANFVGREPNTDWAIELEGKKIRAGDQSDIEPSFKTVLSSGDKTTLALALFIAQIKADSQISNAVIVFDDPFNSQDMARQFETSSQIRSISNSACQTIVLSHDPRFLAMIEKDAKVAETRTYQVLCSDSGSGTITQWSSVDELKALYVRQSEIIREYANHGSLLNGVTPNEVLKSIRPFLEDYLGARYPGRFNSSDLIVKMTDAIKAAGPSDPLFSSAEILFALNEYSRVNMHGGGASPDPGALRAQCRKIVRMVGAY